jgi:quercetin dioxygenase-like cupin family protein
LADHGAGDGRRQLGTTLRAARTRKALSLSDVASATGISASFLSLVENGRSDIAIGRLVRLLAFYEIPINDILIGPVPGDGDVTRSAEGSHLPSREEGIDWVLLTRDTKHLMMPMLISFAPGASLAEHGCHEGEEFVYVLEGTMKLELAGRRTRTLQTGDSAYYQASEPHLFRNASKSGTLRILCVDAPPNL